MAERVGTLPSLAAEATGSRPGRELARVPAQRPPAPEVPGPMVVHAEESADAPRPERAPPAAPRGTLLLAATAAVATFGWLVERRRRRLLESEKDSVLWAQVEPLHATGSTAPGLEQVLADGADPEEAAREIHSGAAIGETASRREATLIDLHQLEGKLLRRRKRADPVSAVQLLQEHLVDFRYTSPWVFLELRELYKEIGRRTEWEIARRAFRQRFGQNAPAWEAPSTGDAQLLDDPVAQELAREWPYREARMVVLRWVLGEHEARHKGSGPPLLGLGVYRDLMLVDTLLDEVMDTRTVVTDSLL